MKLTINTPEAGDWTVVQDETGFELYSGHDKFNQLAQTIAERFYDDIEYVEYTDDEFQERF